MNFAAFFSYIFLCAYTPGPNNFMSMLNAGRDGMKRTLPFLFGIFSGFLVVTALAAICCTLLYRLIPAIEPYMICLGAAYLLWLAWTIWRDKPKTEKEAKIPINSFLSGILLQLVNIKVILYGLTAFSSYILPYTREIPQIVGFVFILSFVGFTGCVCWAGFGAILQGFFQNHRKLLNALMALLLVVCAVSMVMEIN